jgi:hypothetical protein
MWDNIAFRACLNCCIKGRYNILDEKSDFCVRSGAVNNEDPAKSPSKSRFVLDQLRSWA